MCLRPLLLQKKVSGKRVTLPAGSTLARVYVRKKLMFLPAAHAYALIVSFWPQGFCFTLDAGCNIQLFHMQHPVVHTQNNFLKIFTDRAPVNWYFWWVNTMTGLDILTAICKPSVIRDSYTLSIGFQTNNFTLINIVISKSYIKFFCENFSWLTNSGPGNAVNSILESPILKISQGSMPPDHPRSLHLLSSSCTQYLHLWNEWCKSASLTSASGASKC